MKKTIICLFVFFLALQPGFTEQPQLQFEHLSVDQGLSQSEVNCICQDKKGFIWIGTLDGLNRYDGYDFKVYRANTDIHNSISDNYIESIYEDHQGNLWIGTLNGGLNRYKEDIDGFITYTNQKNNLKSIASNGINCILQNEKGDLLLGTQKGLSVLRHQNVDKINPNFSNYFDFEINTIIEDRKGFYWLGTWDGLYKVKFDIHGNPIIIGHYNYNANSTSSLLSDGILSLYQDMKGNIWVGTNNGLDMIPYDHTRAMQIQHFCPFQNIQNNKNSLSNNEVLAIFQDTNGKILIGTRGGGINYFNKNKNNFYSYKEENYNVRSLSNNSVKCFYEDKTGVLWIGTLGGGINKLDLFRKKFNDYRIFDNKNEQSQSNYIREIYEDENKVLWIGTLDGGLYKFLRNTNTFIKFPSAKSNNENSILMKFNKTVINGNNIFVIRKFDTNQLWIGTNGGINILNTNSNQIGYRIADYNNPDSLISNSVFSLCKDDDGSMWIGTWVGLNHYVLPKNGHRGYFIRYTHNNKDSNSLSNNVVRYIYNDPLNTDMWICTMGGGLDRLIQNTDNKSITFVNYVLKKEDPKSISSNDVNMVLRSKAGTLWIATTDGLNEFIPGNTHSSPQFKKYKEKDGLSGNLVQSILEDDKGNLWLGTNKGLSKFNPNTKVFNNYDKSDGLQSNEFSEHTCFENKEGEMFFGGVNGFNSFYPDSIKSNRFIPKAVITNLLIFNKPVPIGKCRDGRTILSKSVTETRKIKLSFKDEIFTLEFSALHFASPNKNKYAYKLVGFNKNWIYTDAKNRTATFTNLRGGIYFFEVKASNNDGVWQKNPTKILIQIVPPIWKTKEAYSLYLLIILIVAYLIFKEVRIRERLKAEVTIKNLEREKTEELTQMKLQFFTNLSHEFRTPLTLIISPIENILSSINKNSVLKNHLLMVYRNAKYLLSLVNELMYFRKAENGVLQLSASKNDLIAFVRDIFSSYTEMAEKRQIKFDLSTELDSINVWFDREMLIKILNNLIYNAFKFTADGGTIDIIIEKGKGIKKSQFSNKYEITDKNVTFNEDECISIIVKDNGIGISKDSIINIFDRYFQIDSLNSVKHMGSGIGLALTKSLVLMHKGEIAVASERYKGTEFIVRLQLGDNHLAEVEKVITSSTAQIDEKTDDLMNLYDNSIDNQEINDIFVQFDNTNAPSILIVEDNDELRQYIKSNLERKFRVYEALNGKEGYRIALEKVPDLIVSDIVMPEMGGILLCKKLKKDIITSHIPIILLTALTSVKDQIEGLETGADDYISKPFNYQLFEIRIENLILSRKKLRERFGKEIEVESKDFTLNWRDQEFLDKAIKLIKEQISNPELSVDTLSKEIGMSRMHLHRKLTALTDQTPSEFIRTIRLKEAAHLLAENRFSISEIAYRVGFTAPSYFTTSFGKQFGISPKEYMGKYSK